MAEFTTTQVLDELIAAYPQQLEYYRTRGIVHCFRDEFSPAIKDFTYALKEARTQRKTRAAHAMTTLQTESRNKGKKKKHSKKCNGQAPPNGTSSIAETTIEGANGELLLLHPSVLPDAPEPIEHQLLFLRGAGYLQQAIFLVEEAILNLEGIHKVPTVDGSELRLCYLGNCNFGGVEIGHPDGPLGKRDGPKQRAYRQVLADEEFRDVIYGLLKKSMRDHDKFLSHFDSLESPDLSARNDDIAKKVERAFLLAESVRPGNHSSSPSPPPDVPAVFTTYHPLLVEAHFSILICQLLLADFTAILPTFVRTASLVDGLEGYPVFLPPRSMAQAEFIEVLERLASGWRIGTQPHSLMHNGNGKFLAIEASRPPSPDPPQPESSVSSSCELDPQAPSSSKLRCPPSSRQSQPSRTINGAGRPDLVEALDSARILLAPVASRQWQRAEATANEKANGNNNKKKPLPINIPLHGPRVEVILAWLGAVQLPELEVVA